MDKIVTEKKCIECGEVKLVESFKQGGMFLSTMCQECRDKLITLPYPTSQEMARENDWKQRAKKLSIDGVITAYEWMDLKEKYIYTCLCCKRSEPEIKLTLDHVVPLNVGGKHAIENAQPLCGSCNSKKGTKTIDYRW